jgi:hypothetical protein
MMEAIPGKIPFAFQDRYVYHFTQVSNLPTILAQGLLSIREQQRLGLPLRTVVWDAVQRHRAQVEVPVGPGGHYEEYIPFYFCKLSPMLLAIMGSKVIDEEKIIHFEFPIEILEQQSSVFTDAGVIPNSRPKFYNHPEDLSHLNWSAIDSPAWRMPTESLRHARLSELLIPRQMLVTAATRLIVWDSTMAGQVLQLYQSAGLVPPRIETDPTCYFLESHAPLKPAISGPTLIYQAYQNAIQELDTRLNQAKSPRFATLDELRDCLQRDLTYLPETAELAGLETDNRAHFEDVGAHTRRVVAETMRSPEYAALSTHDRAILELAAFLHDIGKGPKARWALFDGKQQLDPDHPIKALPMLQRILIHEVAAVDYEDAVLLCKLVVYHDIIGGILFSGRRLEELLGIFEKPREFEMLMGLGRADSVAINPDWNHEDQRAALRQAVLPLLKTKGV